MKTNGWKKSELGIYVNDILPGWGIQYNASVINEFDEIRPYTYSIYFREIEQTEGDSPKVFETLEEAIGYINNFVLRTVGLI